MVQANRVNNMGKIIAVASGKGGTGKTTSVAALSSCLATLGYRTLAVDFDAGLKSLDFALCMTDYAISDYMDVLKGIYSLENAIHEHQKIPNLFFLAAPNTSMFDTAPVELDALHEMYDRIRNSFDYCLIDAPAGIGEGFRLAHNGADMSVLVTNGELPAMRNAQRAAGIIRSMGVEEVRLLVNRVSPSDYKKLHSTIDDVIDAVGARLIGMIREDKSIMLALHDNIPLILYKKRLAAYDFLDAARRIRGEDIPIRKI